jgi:hypothetical protein
LKGNRGNGTYADFPGKHGLHGSNALIDLQGIEYLEACDINGCYTISSVYVVFQTTGGSPVYGTLDY